MSGTCWCHYQYKSNIQPFLFSPCFYNFTPNCFEALLTLRLLAYGWLWVLETLALATFLLLAFFFFPCLSVWSGLLLLLVFENCTFKIWNFELDFFKYGKKFMYFLHHQHLKISASLIHLNYTPNYCSISWHLSVPPGSTLFDTINTSLHTTHIAVCGCRLSNT